MFVLFYQNHMNSSLYDLIFVISPNSGTFPVVPQFWRDTYIRTDTPSRKYGCALYVRASKLRDVKDIYFSLSTSVWHVFFELALRPRHIWQP